MPRFQKSDPIVLWLGITLAVSLSGLVDGGRTWHLLALAPVLVGHGQIWRLVTFIFIEPSPYALLLTCAAIYRFGSELLPRWGRSRMQGYVLRVVLVSAGVTCLLALLVPSSRYRMHLGGFVVADVLCIAWARQFPTEVLALFGLVRLSGRDLVRATCLVTIIYSLYAGPLAMAPSLVACACAALFPVATLRRG